ncbi:hypothetical protein J437_LFUL003011 [Ladona fulva]|uniref:Uncharacterized protein n=1 Tax=Ladona fulva TaxID=123851 RepID=A0A8K0JV00_LADFU|nr:hypothetical protein J437_LFUL003011 [Ladona fulva]
MCGAAEGRRTTDRKLARHLVDWKGRGGGPLSKTRRRTLCRFNGLRTKKDKNDQKVSFGGSVQSYSTEKSAWNSEGIKKFKEIKIFLVKTNNECLCVVSFHPLLPNKAFTSTENESDDPTNFGLSYLMVDLKTLIITCQE